MEVRGISHAALLVSDVEESCRFYGGVLGMEEVPRPEQLSVPGRLVPAAGRLSCT